MKLQELFEKELKFHSEKEWKDAVKAKGYTIEPVDAKNQPGRVKTLMHALDKDGKQVGHYNHVEAFGGIGVLKEAAVEWRPIRKWPNYEVSSDGRVRVIKTGKIMAPWESKRRGGGTDLRVSLYRRNKEGQLEKKGLRIHRLVAKAFLPNPKKLREVDHIDGNSHNNHVRNLEWVTAGENIRRKHERLNKEEERMT